ncbi:hypothetical protein SAURM35S_06239 [Streptomyces aurantiogriseus]
MPARPPRCHLPAHQDLEGIPRPRARRQARPDGARAGALPGPGVCVRRVRPARHPPHHRSRLGPRRPPRTPSRDLPPHPRRPVLPRLLLRRRRHPVGRQPQEEGRRGEHPGRPEVDPRGPPGRCPDLRHPGQPLGSQGRDHPGLGEEEPGRAVLHPDVRVLGQPDRGPLRTITAVHHRQLQPPQPHRTDPSPPRLLPLAEREHPPPRRAGRPTPRTRPYPQREGHPLGQPLPELRVLPGGHALRWDTCPSSPCGISTTSWPTTTT